MTCSEKEQLLLTALEESQSLFAAMLHENRPKCEIEEQMVQNRKVIESAYRSLAQHVEFPEPAAFVHTPTLVWNGKIRPVLSFEKYEDDYKSGVYSLRIPLYTEHQVRDILAQYGIN